MRPRRILPGPGQESVWDYPRPPRVEPVGERVRVEFHGLVLANSARALRVLETSHPPAVYIPPEDVRMEFLSAAAGSSACEWKGQASYFNVEVSGKKSVNAAWSYLRPKPEYAALTGMIAFYPSRVDACYLGEERVRAQEGGFYGGWITSRVVGPFKGEAGTWGW